MTANETTEVGKMLVLMAENFGAELSEARTRFIIRELDGFPFAQVKAGLGQLVRTRKYPGFPNLAEILESVGGQAPNPKDALAAEAERQWLILLNTDSQDLRRGYRDGNIERGPDGVWRGSKVPIEGLDAPARAAFAAMGGDKALWSERELHYRHREFVDLYKTHAQAERRALPAPTGEIKRLALAVARKEGSRG